MCMLFSFVRNVLSPVEISCPCIVCCILYNILISCLCFVRNILSDALIFLQLFDVLSSHVFDNQNSIANILASLPSLHGYFQSQSY
jgi:hypothetical protein